MMYLETRFFDSGKATAQLHKTRPVGMNQDDYDHYIDEIGEGGGYASLEAWIEELEIELDDIIPLVIDLEAGKTVDISGYC